MKSFIKMAFFPPLPLVPFPIVISIGIFLALPGRAEHGGFHFKQGSRVHQITRGLSENTYLLSKLGEREREWMEVSRGSSEEEVFKATGGLLPRGFSGRRAFSSDPRQPSPGAEITKDCLNLQKRRCGPEATACELTN